MAFYDRRTLDGVYSVRQSVNHIMNYRFAEVRMMRMMAGWIALTPEIPVKLEMAKQVYEDALHADALGKRLPELRAGASLQACKRKLRLVHPGGRRQGRVGGHRRTAGGNLPGAETSPDRALQRARDGRQSGL